MVVRATIDPPPSPLAYFPRHSMRHRISMHYLVPLLCLFPGFAIGAVSKPEINRAVTSQSSAAVDASWREHAIPVFEQPPLVALEKAGNRPGLLTVRRHSEAQFDEVLEVETSEISKNSWDAQLRAKTSVPLAPDEIVLIHLFVRASHANHESGEAMFGLTLEEAGGRYEKIIGAQYNVAVGREWREIYIRRPVLRKGEAWAAKGFPDGLPAGGAQLCFNLAFEKQAMEIAGLEVFKFPAGTDINTLPQTRLGYPGSEPDAPWRAAAEARIEAHRKQDLQITVLDADGSPLPGAEVKIEQQTHAFRFSTAIAPSAMKLATPEDRDGAEYRRRLKVLFNSASLENDLKWLEWEKAAADRAPVKAVLEWCRENNLSLRGHTLFWTVWKFLPKDFFDLHQQPEAYRARLFSHVDEILEQTNPYVDEWDVVNEASRDREEPKICSPELMADLFRHARRKAPAARLILNEQGTLSPSDRLDALEANARALIDAGTPLDGLGIQCHYGDIGTPPEQIIKSLDRLAALGKTLQITEFDVNASDETYQADYLHDFYLAVFSHPAVDKIQMWGFWAGRHWMPRAALYRLDWSEKPAGKTYRELAWSTWWTNQTLTSDQDGKLSTRAFKGDYRITVEKEGRVLSRSITLDKQPQSLSITLK